jgi:molybdate transport system substrate-binding protein
VQAKPGTPVGSLVAKGEVELGFQQLAELIHLPGVDILGPLPAGAQSTTTFCGGVATTSIQPEAARTWLGLLASSAADQAKRRNGMEPA